MHNFLDADLSQLLKQLKGFKNRQDSRCLLVPHASLKYSGLCALSAFLRLDKRVKHIILLSTNHFSQEIIPNYTTHHPYVVNSAIIKFLRPDITIESYAVGAYHPIFAQALAKMYKDATVALVFDTDLTHYGSRFDNTSFPEPQQAYKILIEEPLIEALQNHDFEMGQVALKNPKLNACGSAVLLTLLNVISRLQLNGEVTCYYDSTNIPNKLLKIITYEPQSFEFVSYLGMAFTKTQPVNTIENLLTSRFNQLHLLSIVKYIVDNDAKDYILPSWSPWWDKKNGAFVGLETNNETRASIGHYQSAKMSLPDNVIVSASGCLDDARDRWGMPITAKDFTNLTYYINILQDMKLWNNLSNTAPKRCKHGVHLQVKNNGPSATFLPSVWCDYKTWDFQKLLDELLVKAGGDDLEGSDIQLYETYFISSDSLF